MTYYKVVDGEEINKVEELRKDSYGFQDSNNAFYLESLKNKTMIAVAAYEDNKMVAASYISGYLDSLYIENIFTRKEYRGMKKATNLIDYIITNKEVFENFFNKKFVKSKLEPNSLDIIHMYQKLGYSEPNSFNVMSKRI